MSYKRKNVTYLVLILVLVLMLVIPLGCVYKGSPLIDVIVENQTKQVLKISVDADPVGEVQPDAQSTRIEAAMDMGEYVVEAKNVYGEVVFSEKYTFNPYDKYHLQKVEDRIYKAVIPPLEKGTEISDNITTYNITAK